MKKNMTLKAYLSVFDTVELEKFTTTPASE